MSPVGSAQHGGQQEGSHEARLAPAGAGQCLLHHVALQEQAGQDDRHGVQRVVEQHPLCVGGVRGGVMPNYGSRLVGFFFGTTAPQPYNDTTVLQQRQGSGSCYPGVEKKL